MSARANDLRRAAVRCCVMTLLFILATSVPGHERTSLVYGSIDSSASPPIPTSNSLHQPIDIPNSLSDIKSTLTPPSLIAVKAINPLNAHFVNRSSRGVVEQIAHGCELTNMHPGVKAGNGGFNDDMQGNFVKFAILLPEQPSKRRDIRILSTVLPVIEMATRKVTAPGGLLQNFRIEIDHRDTQCSSTYGALGAFDIFLKRKPAPIARYSSVWGIPLITSGGLTEAFTLKDPNYRTLTRMMGNYHAFGLMMREIHRHYNWTIQAYLYHEWDEKSGRGFTDCSMAISSINRAISGNETSSGTFDEETAKYADYLRLLRQIEKRARVARLRTHPRTHFRPFGAEEAQSDRNVSLLVSVTRKLKGYGYFSFYFGAQKIHLPAIITRLTNFVKRGKMETP
uniref:Receptor ligand binding region domain-containing protein n=1 Tax=Anopheles culicifacies TaxID=139723 RepID=A0A182MQK0_9DIPT